MLSQMIQLFITPEYTYITSQEDHLPDPSMREPVAIIRVSWREQLYTIGVDDFPYLISFVDTVRWYSRL